MWMHRPTGYGDFDLLGLSAMYSVTWTGDPRVAFFQEHRMAIPPIWAALNDGIFGESRPLLVRLDAHTDYAEEGDRFDYASLRPKIKTIEDCILFANSLPADDGGWVETVIRFGWVSDVICSYVQPSEWEFFRKPVVDIDQEEHTVTVYPDLAEPAPDLGCGQVQLDERPLRTLIEGLGICKPTMIPASLPPIWLDIDLDFAVENVRDADSRPLTPTELIQKLSQPIRCVPLQDIVSAKTVLTALMAHARLITIASEPGFTCGFNGVAQVMASLRTAFPEHKRLFSWFEG